jgi:protein phosphatase
MVEMANRAGGIDNITAVLLDVSEGDSEGAIESRAAIPQQPTAPHPIPAAERTDVTVVGRPIPSPPARDRSRARIARRVGIGTGITLGIVVLGVVVVRLYVDTQWFVGVSNGRVAIFRGVPAEVAGFDLNSVVVETSIPAEEVESLAVYRDQLADGITADDRGAADEIVEQIRSDVADARATGP